MNLQIHSGTLEGNLPVPNMTESLDKYVSRENERLGGDLRKRMVSSGSKKLGHTITLM